MRPQLILLRYYYVKCSLQTAVIEAINRNQFMYTCLFFPQLLLLVHLINSLMFIRAQGIHEYPMMLFNACLDPYNVYELNFNKLLPLDQILIYSYTMIFICSNFYLYKFLK